MVSVASRTVPSPRKVLAAAPLPPEPRGDRAGYLRLDMNEDLAGPLLRVPMSRSVELAMYQTAHDLQAALAVHLRVPAQCIRVTAGADEAIYGLFRAYLDPGDGVLLPDPTFVEFPTAAHGAGAVIDRAPYGPDLQFPFESFRAALRHDPKLAVIVSPANPTGDTLATDRVLGLAASAPGTLLLVDEAYAEYGGASVLDGGMPPPNVAVIRTFSKAYGLAGARVGYLVAHPHVLDAVRKVLPAYSMAGPSLVLARAGLARQDRLARRLHAVSSGQRRIAAWGQRHGLHVHRTATNFILLRFPDDAAAHMVARELEARHILVSLRAPALPGTLRVSIGTRQHVAAFLQALEEILHG